MDSKKVNCSNCYKLVPHTNFCSECGSKLQIIDNCPICLETIYLETTLCGHNVCNNCISKLKISGNTCHICRKSLGNWMDQNDNSLLNDEDIDPSLILLCPFCYSQNHTHIQREGNYCINCKQYFDEYLKIQEEQLREYPILDKEDVNPTKIGVCEHCYSDRYEYDGPQWDMVTNCLNCGKRDIKIIFITKMVSSQMSLHLRRRVSIL